LAPSASASAAWPPAWQPPHTTRTPFRPCGLSQMSAVRLPPRKVHLELALHARHRHCAGAAVFAAVLLLPVSSRRSGLGRSTSPSASANSPLVQPQVQSTSDPGALLRSNSAPNPLDRPATTLHQGHRADVAKGGHQALSRASKKTAPNHQLDRPNNKTPGQARLHVPGGN